MKIYPSKKWRALTSFSNPEGGTQGFGVDLTQEHAVLAILKGEGHKQVSTL